MQDIPSAPSWDQKLLRSSIVTHEGLRSRLYRDTKGIQSIGIGRNLQKGLSPAEIDFLYENDVAEAVDWLDGNEPGWRQHSDPAQRFLIEMVFNMGGPTWEQFHNTRRALYERRWGDVKDGIKHSKWRKDVGEKRYEDMCALIDEAAALGGENVA